MDIIRNNPYRVLGVLANASRKDIERNKSQIKAFAKVGRTPSFPYDFEDVLGKVERTEESLNDAVSKLTFDKDKVAYGLFWFNNTSFVDEETLALLKDKGIGAAISYMRTCGRQEFSTYINLGSLSLISRNWGNAAYCFARLFDSQELWNKYVESITDNPLTISYEEELGIFVENLISAFPSVNWLEVFHGATFMVIAKDAQCSVRLSKSNIYKNLLPKYQNKIISAIDELLNEASSVDRKNANANLSMAAKLEQSCKDLLATLKSIFCEDDTTYTHYADKVALQTLNNCVYYFNNDQSNPACPKNVLRYVRFCVKTAEGQLAKDRCKKNFDVIKEAYDNMCPQEVLKEVTYIEEQMKRTFSKSDIIDNDWLINSILECQKKLQDISKSIGANEKYYWRLSERLVLFFLNNIIDCINTAMKAYEEAPQYNDYTELYQLRMLLKKCKPIFSEIQLLPKKNAESISNFNKNYQKFKELCQDYHIDEFNNERTYDQPTSPHSSSINSSFYNKNKNSIYHNVERPKVYGVNSSGSNKNFSQDDKDKNEMTGGEKFLLGIVIVLLITIFIFILITTNSPVQKSPQKVATENTSQSTYLEADSAAADTTYYDETTNTENTSGTYDVTYYETGDRPYIEYYGKGNYDRRTKNSLRIENGSESDAVVFLESVSGKKVRHVYIKKGEHFKMIQIPGGKYIIKVYQGNFWNAEKYNGENAPEGGFMENVSMSKSDISDTFDYPYPKSGRYFDYEVTLYKVENGNFHTENISENEMFN